MKRVSLLVVASALFIPAGRSASASEFNWENMIHAWMKLNIDFNYSKAQVDSYMQLFRPDVWKNVRNNEFEREKARTETTALMKMRVQDFNLKEDIVLNTTLPIGQFNFDTETFPIEKMRDTTYWYPQARYSENLPSNLHIFISNTKSFDALKMSKEAAAALVKERNEKFRGDRNLAVTIKFRVTKLRSRDTEILAEIQSLTLFRDPKRNEVLAVLKNNPEKEESKK